jgi:hypothetical protein
MMMTDVLERPTALTAPNQLIETGGRTLAYRTFGTGPNLVLCIRLRGTMDMWVIIPGITASDARLVARTGLWRLSGKASPI